MADARYVALSETDHRVGETHHNARLTDKQVDQIRDEFEAYPVGHPLHLGYRALSKKWKVGKRTIRDIVNYDRRNQWAARWKRVEP